MIVLTEKTFMKKAPLVAYGIIAVLTPVLVLINGLLIVSDSTSSVQPFRSMSLAQWLMKPEISPETIITAYDLMPQSLKEPGTQTITEQEQPSLEFSQAVGMTRTQLKTLLETLSGFPVNENRLS